MLNACSIHRLSNWLYEKKIPVLPSVLYRINFFIFNSSLPPSTRIGKDSRCAYGGIGVVVQSGISIGENVMIGQNVTIGGDFERGKSSIGNNVYIGAGSRIISSSVGDNVVIGVNSVLVNKEIPNNVVVAGVPAKIIGTYDSDKHRWLSRRSK